MRFMNIRLLCVFIYISSICAYYIDNCSHRGPDYWCQNEETAIECGAIEYCNLKNDGWREKVLQEQHPPLEPVRIGVYYESLCDDCQQFIKEQLYPTYLKLERSGMLAIDLYPFGNAEERRETNGWWTYTCQHGSKECTMNTVEACALQLLSREMRLPFIQCVEKKPTVLNAQECAHNLSVNWNSISSCSKGQQGNFYEHVMALETLVLDPPHWFVPWITLNGTHTDDIQKKATSNLLKLVCDSFPGYKPKECTKDLEYIPSMIGKCYRPVPNDKIPNLDIIL